MFAYICADISVTQCTWSQTVCKLHVMQLVVTDNDLIEKSNLNRQFLFRPEHIRVRIILCAFFFDCLYFLAAVHFILCFALK